jgi:RNA polymerase sigma-70 factor (ECF subfamily)
MRMATNRFTDMAEEEIFKRIVQGEIGFYELLVRKYNAHLYRIARCYGFNHENAEELMLATYLRAYTQLAGFELGTTFKIPIVKILVHKCVYKLSYGYFI